jgi:hypothetical protein
MRWRLRGVMHLRPVVLALMSMVLAASGSSCGGAGGEGVGGAVDVLAAIKYQVSTLTLNLRGIHEEWEDGTTLPWRDRYDRVAQWMADTKTLPDVIGLQEVWLRKRFFAGGLAPHDYETLFELITRIKQRTNASYRIAYASSQYVPQGVNVLWSGKAVLYNGDRLRNTTGASLATGTSESVVPWDDQSTIGAHLRQSHPCTETRPEQAALCSLIDGDGRYLTLSYRTASGTWRIGPTTSSFELKNDPALQVLVHNVHVQTDDYDASFKAIRDLVSAANTRWAARPQPYPPILEGDFNVSYPNMQTETGSGGFAEDFFIAGFAASDVVGVLVGDTGSYPSRFTPVWEPQVVPVEAPIEELGLCSPGSSLWSDHCGIFVSLHPPIRTSPPQ